MTPLDEAIARFREVRWLELGIASRADVVANFLRFAPLGLLFSGAAGAIALTAIVGATLSLVIEFTQVYFPVRTLSLNDSAAESAGANAGALVWSPLGPAVAAVLRDLAATRTRSTLAASLLETYVVLFLGAQFMPLDLTFDPGEIAQTAHEGRVSLVPFTHEDATPADATWDLGADVVLFAPLGALAFLRIGDDRRRSRSTTLATLVGITVALAVEVAQVLMYTRCADANDVLAGALRALAGALLLNRPLSRLFETLRLHDPPVDSSAPRGEEADVLRAPLSAALAWVSLLAAIAWRPFDFRIDRQFLKERLAAMRRVPFAALDAGSDYHAFIEVGRKFVLAVPLGFLLQLARRRRFGEVGERLALAAALSVSAGVLLLIEFGQVFVPERLPDAADVAVGGAGSPLGVLGARQWRDLVPVDRFDADECELRSADVVRRT